MHRRCLRLQAVRKQRQTANDSCIWWFIHCTGLEASALKLLGRACAGPTNLFTVEYLVLNTGITVLVNVFGIHFGVSP